MKRIRKNHYSCCTELEWRSQSFWGVHLAIGLEHAVDQLVRFWKKKFRNQKTIENHSLSVRTLLPNSSSVNSSSDERGKVRSAHRSRSLCTFFAILSSQTEKMSGSFLHPKCPHALSKPASGLWDALWKWSGCWSILDPHCVCGVHTMNLAWAREKIGTQTNSGEPLREARLLKVLCIQKNMEIQERLQREAPKRGSIEESNVKQRVHCQQFGRNSLGKSCKYWPGDKLEVPELCTKQIKVFFLW